MREPPGTEDGKCLGWERGGIERLSEDIVVSVGVV
jgi:hypothetical protein